MVKSNSLEIISGTYEEYLLGYSFSAKEGNLVQSFAAHDHSASIRCVALGGHFLASGAADDRIFIYDLKSRKQHCTLTHHNATVNCLQFTDNHSHLLSGSSDGVLAIVRVGNWQLEKVWEKAHKGAAILDIAVHSSGKLALTLGADGTLCTWNLVKGRQAYVINLKSKCKDARSLDRILWAPDGVHFVLFGGKYAEVWSIESGGFLKQIEHKEKVTACIWLDDNNLIIGHENGEITNFDLEDEEKTSLKAHKSRVKSLAISKKHIISISSNGEIKIWNIHLEELAVVDTGCRLTSLCVVPPLQLKIENNQEPIIEEIQEPVQKKKKISKAQVIEIVENDDDPEVTLNKNLPDKSDKKKKKKNKKT